MSDPSGLVIVIIALPAPWLQSIVKTGVSGEGGCEPITTLPDSGDVHPEAFVTVNLYVPFAGSPVIVVEVPVPEVVTPPGLRITVHVPPDGSPLSTTLPVATTHVGCVMVPTTGGVGVGG